VVVAGAGVAGAGCCWFAGGTVRVPGSSKSLSWGLPTVFVSCASIELAAIMMTNRPSPALIVRKERLIIEIPEILSLARPFIHPAALSPSLPGRQARLLPAK
jgi:hypothetical protein